MLAEKQDSVAVHLASKLQDHGDMRSPHICLEKRVVDVHSRTELKQAARSVASVAFEASDVKLFPSTSLGTGICRK